jgi:hypothetical protein
MLPGSHRFFFCFLLQALPLIDTIKIGTAAFFCFFYDQQLFCAEND